MTEKDSIRLVAPACDFERLVLHAHDTCLYAAWVSHFTELASSTHGRTGNTLFTAVNLLRLLFIKNVFCQSLRFDYTCLSYRLTIV